MLYRVDPLLYSTLYKDVEGFNEQQILNHYVNIGVKEGRIGRAEDSREHFTKSIPRGRPILEIGPFCYPSLVGPDMKYADVMTAEEIREDAVKYGGPLGYGQNIDYVIKDENYDIIKEKFFAVHSSHCIEHIPDLIGHLQSVEKILEDGGKYYLIVPDKRYCFDHFIPESSFDAVLEAHLKEKTAPDLRNVLVSAAYLTHNDAKRHWRGDHGEIDRAAIPERLERAKQLFLERKEYDHMTTHLWQFTPESFFDVFSTMADLGYTKLRPVDVHPTLKDALEFCAVLG